jgi:acetyltransferase-like isoleucine patch superfamily enzyme
MSLSSFCVCFVTVDVIELRHASVAIGTGSMLMAGARTTVSTSIGSHFIANLNCTLGHDAAIGDFVTVAPLVAISGGVRIGNGVEIGTGACLREGIQVGDGALIGMGAVVVKDVPANAVVVGNPARQIRSLEPW